MWNAKVQLLQRFLPLSLLLKKKKSCNIHMGNPTVWKGFIKSVQKSLWDFTGDF